MQSDLQSWLAQQPLVTMVRSFILIVYANNKLFPCSITDIVDVVVFSCKNIQILYGIYLLIWIIRFLWS